MTTQSEEGLTEFCRHCGAGIGIHRRPGEGTCPRCDPVGVAANSVVRDLRSFDSRDSYYSDTCSVAADLIERLQAQINDTDS